MWINSYGQQARVHWRTWRPSDYAEATQHPQGEDAFFAELGNQVATEIGERTQRRVSAADARGELSGLSELRLWQLHKIHRGVEDEVLRDRVLRPPEPGADDAADGSVGGGLRVPGEPGV